MFNYLGIFVVVAKTLCILAPVSPLQNRPSVVREAISWAEVLNNAPNKTLFTTFRLCTFFSGYCEFFAEEPNSMEEFLEHLGDEMG